MSSGGARARSGPAPDENALRRARDSQQWRVLPAAGREGPPPPWPFAVQSPRERILWDRLWARPEAVGWDEEGELVENVALHVRTFAEAEEPGAATPLRTLVRQQQEELGLNDSGRRRRSWRIAAAEPAEEPAAGPARKGRAPAKRSSSRDRLKVVAGGGR